MADRESNGVSYRSRRQGVSRIPYTDPQGFKWLVDVPQGMEDRPELGVRVGPPDLSDTDLPEDIARRLNHQLFNRGIITTEQATARTGEITAALSAALKVSTTTILNLYQGG